MKDKMNNEKLEIKKENVLAAYKTAREAGEDSTCKVLEELFDKDMFKLEDVTKRIKTFEDACRELGEEHQFVKAYREWMRIEYAGCKDIAAYLKLRIICAALNEGWKPQFTDDEFRYYPWFYIYTKKVLEEMDEEGRSRVVVRSDSYAYADAGVGRANCSFDSSNADANIGSRLAFKSEALAVYCGQQFIDIWADFVC